MSIRKQKQAEISISDALVLESLQTLMLKEFIKANGVFFHKMRQWPELISIEKRLECKFEDLENKVIAIGESHVKLKSQL